MADPLYELLIPYFDAQDTHPRPSPTDAVTNTYLSRLTTLPLATLSSSEHQSLSQSSHSVLRSLQVLSKRSHKPIISSTDHLSHLRETLPRIGHNAGTIQSDLPSLEIAAQTFSDKYSKSGDNAILDRRRKAMLLSRNIDRVSDVLDLPTLLSTAISSSTAAAQATASTISSASNANYASALDLYAHIKRLHTLYPNSQLVSSLTNQAEQEMKTMTTNLISSLQSQSIKLAGAMRTIGWLRRVAPELDESWATKQTSIGSGEGTLGALFLVCRLGCLELTLAALDPLRELADQETDKRISKTAKGDVGWAVGQQTEKYLKKYLEVFREQSFAIISMYKSIFPSALPAPGSEETASAVKPATTANPLQPIPSALATFPLHLVEILFDILRTYLPNVQDRSARDSLLTQVLYCAGSLGRLGGDFSMMIAVLEEDLRADLEGDSTEEREIEEEWVEVMKKHRVQASRLELLASGVGAGRTSSPVERTVSPAR
ncbi:Dor1-like family protein-like protein [Dothidotthia symphoricarpi CBS 119687]|uniref:Conserved oligomeric Golgi complex subunit 8 n=1 Tax=Dothidotthia symphoricarpi CBS 119687 TaxID=1392245 RepID=A0A6A6AQE7_9PLEO|nr:Dor1-like family protein-like protein [Dothidotthia symphoricarpi CBS 119687]KAF2133766.1 Dor1-like family protein-like protein [Dothidotthia symphoricarpi CBS 119687]